MSRLPAVLLIAAFAALPARADAPKAPDGPAAPAAPVEMPTLTAPIALMVDMSSGRVLYARQPHRRFMPASLTKIMTAYVAFELIDSGKLSVDQRFRMNDATFRKWHRVGSTMFLDEGSETSVEDLLLGIVTVSANDGCIVLAQGIAGSVPKFVAMMNAKAHELGMHDTHYNTPNGWMDEGRTYVSAADLAKLSRALITRHPALYKHFFGHATMTYNGISQRNHNPLYGITPGADGIKTGFTDQAGYGVVGSAERNGRRLLLVLGAMDNGRERAKEARSFMEWGFDAWDARPLVEAGREVGTATVQGGTAREVGLVAPRRYFVTVPKGARAKSTLSVRYDGPLRAPIAKGQDVATLVVKTPGQPDEDLPLVAAASVRKGGALARMRNGLYALVGK